MSKRRYICFPYAHRGLMIYGKLLLHCVVIYYQQEAQLMLTTGSTRLAVNLGQQT